MLALMALAHTQTTITLDAITVAFIVGVIIPPITAFLTKQAAHPGLKGFVTMLLSGVAGTVAVLTTNAGHAITVRELVLAIGSAWGLAVMSYLGLWRPTGAAPAIARATPQFGIGGPAKGQAGQMSVEQVILVAAIPFVAVGWRVWGPGWQWAAFLAVLFGVGCLAALAVEAWLTDGR